MRIRFVNGTVVEVDSISASYLGIVPSLTIEMGNISIQDAVSIFSNKANIARIEVIDDGEAVTYDGFTKLVGVNVLYRTEIVSITLHRE